jgi:protein TonB
LPGKDKIAVPIEKKVDLTPKSIDDRNPSIAQLSGKDDRLGRLTLPGVLEDCRRCRHLEVAAVAENTGTGTGIGPGSGSGLGPGYGGGTGGGAFRPGNGVELPKVLREVKPQYTAEAMRAKVQGVVWLGASSILTAASGALKS